VPSERTCAPATGISESRSFLSQGCATHDP